MSKARITYRFDKYGNRDQEDAIIVPVHDELSEAVQSNHADRHSPSRMDEADKLGADENIIGEDYAQERTAITAFTQDFGSWTSPFDTEVERLERIIRGDDRNSRTEAPHSEVRTVKEEPWDTGWSSETSNMRDSQMEGPIITDDAYLPYRHTRNGTPWYKLVASVSAAVITGIVLGLLVLTVFTNGGDTEPVDADVESAKMNDTAASQVPASNEDLGAMSDGSGNSEVNSVSESNSSENNARGNEVSLSGRSYHMIQYGMFSTAEGAQTAVQQLAELGLAGAAGSMGDNWYVYAGVSEDKDDILGLAQQLKQREFEVYVKQLDIPATNKLLWQGEDSSKVTSYFNQAQTLVSTVSAITLLHLQEAQPTPLETSSVESIKGTHQQMMILSSQIANGFDGAEATRFQSMNNALNTAVDSMNAYDRSPSRSFLWQAQSAVMRFLLEQHQLVQASI